MRTSYSIFPALDKKSEHTDMIIHTNECWTPDTHHVLNIFLGLCYARPLIQYLLPCLISRLACYDLYSRAALFCFLSPYWEFCVASWQINITQAKSCAHQHDAHIRAFSFPPTCTLISLPAYFGDAAVRRSASECMRKAIWLQYVVSGPQQCKVNPATVCRACLKKEACRKT